MSGINWDTIHNRDESWRTKLIGDISYAFVMPRYVELFEKYFKNFQGLSFLELGSGNGEIASLIAEKKFPFTSRYVTSECFPKGVEWLKEKGLEAVLANAEDIPAKDASFDVVLSFDVMHHVANPRKMASEMMRTARGKLFLTESNGLSVGRKLMELTPGRRMAGEKSYTPSQYRSFFNHPGFSVTRFEIHPFVFPIKLPKKFLNIAISFNRWIETIPLLNWQCSNVYIYLEYERTPS